MSEFSRAYQGYLPNHHIVMMSLIHRSDAKVWYQQLPHIFQDRTSKNATMLCIDFSISNSDVVVPQHKSCADSKVFTRCIPKIATLLGLSSHLIQAANYPLAVFPINDLL
jgi:hypothetical protein